MKDNSQVIGSDLWNANQKNLADNMLEKVLEGIVAQSRGGENALRIDINDVNSLVLLSEEGKKFGHLPDGHHLKILKKELEDRGWKVSTRREAHILVEWD